MNVQYPRPVRQYEKVQEKTPDIYQNTNWSYGQKIKKGERELANIFKNENILYNMFSKTSEHQLSNGVSHLIL